MSQLRPATFERLDDDLKEWRVRMTRPLLEQDLRDSLAPLHGTASIADGCGVRVSMISTLNKVPEPGTAS